MYIFLSLSTICLRKLNKLTAFNIQQQPAVKYCHSIAGLMCLCPLSQTQNV